MNQTQIENLKEVLSNMFPELKPGLIFFELGIEISRTPDWELVRRKAIDYAKANSPQFVEALENI